MTAPLIAPCDRTPAAIGADAPEQRREPRHTATGVARLWLLERLGFLDTHLVDVSRRGVRLAVRGALPRRWLTAGRLHRVDVHPERGEPFRAWAQVRHVTARTVGLEVVDVAPDETLLPRATGSSLAR
jgi:hypothetical protein